MIVEAVIIEATLVPIFGCVFSIFINYIKKYNRKIYEDIR